MSNQPILRTIVTTCAGLILAAGMVGPAVGQGGATLNPADNARRNEQLNSRAVNAAPQPNLSKKYPAWVGYIAIFLMAAGIIPLSLLPSKRSHQD